MTGCLILQAGPRGKRPGPRPWVRVSGALVALTLLPQEAKLLHSTDAKIAEVTGPYLCARIFEARAWVQ